MVCFRVDVFSSVLADAAAAATHRTTNIRPSERLGSSHPDPPDSKPPLTSTTTTTSATAKATPTTTREVGVGKRRRKPKGLTNQPKNSDHHQGNQSLRVQRRRPRRPPRREPLGLNKTAKRGRTGLHQHPELSFPLCGLTRLGSAFGSNPYFPC